MKNKPYLRLLILWTACLFAASVASSAMAAENEKVVLRGTGSTATVKVGAVGLSHDVTLTPSAGFSVSPTVIPAGSQEMDVTITYQAYRHKMSGAIYLRSDMVKRTIELEAYGSALPQKALNLRNNLYIEGEREFDILASDGFNPDTQRGYTVEYRVRTNNKEGGFYPYFVCKNGLGVKAYTEQSGLGVYGSYDAATKRGISNPANASGSFYNNDGEYHTYRFAVTPDSRAIVYRDGMAVDTLRLVDLCAQPEWTNKTGDHVKNLLHNPGFEGEYDFVKQNNIIGYIEGWNVSPFDQYNSTQDIKTDEIDAVQDQFNHTLHVDRYMWNDGWAAAEISQIVDVAPYETYSFSALAKGGVKSDGTLVGSIRINEYPNTDKKEVMQVTSDEFRTYATDYTTSATCKQLRVTFYLERDKWGASISDLVADNVKLSGRERLFKQMIGYVNDGAEVEYLTYDLTGAYAPAESVLAASVDSLTFNGTGASETITLTAANLPADHDITVSAPTGFTATPAVIPAGTTSATITVTYNLTKAKHFGDLVLRCGNSNKARVKLLGVGSALAESDLPNATVLPADKGIYEISDAEGFTPDLSKGYTVEFRARTNKAKGALNPYFVTKNGIGAKAYIEQSGIGLYGSYDYTTKRGIRNPANASGSFYNDDNEYHTYRYAVTPDSRAIVYRDGMALDTIRLVDLCAQPEWTVKTGDYVENLLHNPGFEGEYDFVKQNNIIGYIEGWNVSPFDQYNSTQEIRHDEIDATQDQYNHTLHVDRYMWNDGWAAAEISQIVDVAPNETYSFSALAKGGVKSDGKLLGSIRLNEYPNTEKKETLQITSDDFHTYATDYTTSADCQQLRVTFYLERDKWGASISDLVADNVKLTGRERQFKQVVGYSNDGVELEYFKVDLSGAYAPLAATLETSVSELAINGTGASETFTLTAANLPEGHDITVSAPTGFTATPAIIPAGTTSATITVTYNLTKAKHFGDLVFRCGNSNKARVKLLGVGSALAESDLPNATVLPADKGIYEISDAEGFTPDLSKGYTVEFRARTNKAKGALNPYFVTKNGIGAKGYIEQSGIGLYGSYDYTTKRGIRNPANASGSFYNDDNEYHTYRYAVTPDSRAIVYRDGMALDTIRLVDLCAQPEWTVKTGDNVENLLHNPGFEGEYDFVKQNNIIGYIEGWNVSPFDQYNSTQEIRHDEIDATQDQYNHTLHVDRYMWNDGWAAAEISQIVDVAPNETYSFSALAKGGVKSDGKLLGSIRLNEYPNTEKKETLQITSDDFHTYATDYTTSADCQQLRVTFYLERDKWGASISDLVADNVKLTGRERLFKQVVGYSNDGVDLEYFKVDLSGAYAPLAATLETSVSELAINGTGASETITLTAANLPADHDITVSAPTGFSVTPATLPAGTVSAELTVTYNLVKAKHFGDLVVRCGNSSKACVKLLGVGSPLEVKEIEKSLVLPADKAQFEISDAEGFTPDLSKGYTVEARVRTNKAKGALNPYFVTKNGIGAKGYIEQSGIGLYGSYDYTTKRGIRNPANSSGSFYNDDNEYHTYRYAVTPDSRAIVYRDGMALDTIRLVDLCAQPEWTVKTGDYVENLLHNPGFEGEYDFVKQNNIIGYIEGWNVSPFDQYNSTQEIRHDEIDATQDQYNHTLHVDRYMWNDGWAAAEISQIVDVAPNETYSFSALAKGGVKSDGKLLGSIRLNEYPNTEKKETLQITSDDFHTYATDYTTSADCQQLRVTFYLERDKWGASISDLVADNVKLTGRERLFKQVIGFINSGVEIDYIACDLTGAYAPVSGSIGDAIADQTENKISVSVSDRCILVLGAKEGQPIAVYDVAGRLLATRRARSQEERIVLPRPGVCIVKVGNTVRKVMLR